MSTNVLFSRTTGQVIEAQDVNQYKTALDGDVVPRVAGSPVDGGGNLGNPVLQWSNMYFNGSLIQNGNVIDFGSLASIKNQIKTGYSYTDGFPRFLKVSPSSLACAIDTDGGNNSLSCVIDGSAVVVNADLDITGLSSAPSTNNTCLVNGPEYDDGAWTEIIGERPFGYESRGFKVNTIGSEITALDKTIQSFKKGNEIFIAYVDITNNCLMPLRRGIARTNRESLLNNDTITLLKNTFLFLENNATNVYKTNNFPYSADVDPSTGTTGEFYYNTSLGGWKRYNGTTWEAQQVVMLGYAIQDDTECVGVECVDYNIGWQSQWLADIRFFDDTKLSVSINEASVVGTFYERTNDGGRIIDLSLVADRDTGVSYTADTQYYIYVDSNYNLLFSDIVPRPLDWRSGFYHPLKYYRCVGKVYNNSSNVLEGLTQDLFPKFLTRTSGGIIEYDTATSLNISLFEGYDSTGNEKIKTDRVININFANDMASGSVSADTTYHILVGETPFGIQAKFSATLTKPAGFLNYRRVGSIITDASSNIIQFTSYEKAGGGVENIYKTGIREYAGTNPGTSGKLIDLTVPSSLNITPIISCKVIISVPATVYYLLTSPDQDDVVPSVSLFDAEFGQEVTVGINKLVRTNTSGQVRTRLSATGSGTTEYIDLFGYTDERTS